jgi:hypothetical protein
MQLRLARLGIKALSPTLFAALLGALVFLGLSLGARPAAAYPQFQFSSGTNRCSQCHYSPAGGGLLTSWGRDESADTISLGGDGAFLHGLVSLPSWLGIGGDFRLAFTSNDVGDPSGTQLAVFPMQADLYLRAALGEAWSINGTVGVRGIVRPSDGSISGRIGAAANDIMSREHYIMWRPSATGPYGRVGRFFAPYGIRFVEHIFYVRRYTGNNLYEETYNASGGYVADDWELHGTLFAPTPKEGAIEFVSGVGPPEYGFAGYGEIRLAKMSALAGQVRVGISGIEARYQVGGIGKLWLEKAKLLFLGEADFIHQTFPSPASYAQNQFVSYTGAHFFPVRGLMGAVAYERYQENLSVSTTGRNAFDLELNFFPWAHCEVVLLGRYQIVGSGAIDGGSATLGMLQLHYYL